MKRGDAKKGTITFFLPPGLWRLDPFRYTGWKRYLAGIWQMTAFVLRDFFEDHCLLQASALSFTTILSIVPFFALTFAVLKGFGVQNLLEPLILNQVAAGSQEIVSKIVTYINNTNMKSMGTVGLFMLIITAISLLASVEESFNHIWGVREDRSLRQKFSDYLSVTLSAPLLTLAAVSITTSLENQTVVLWLLDREYLGDVLLAGARLFPYVSIWIALVFLYMFIPNTKVRFSSAMVGGILAGTVWQIAQWGYIHFQVGVGRYNAIYGTLALVPIFMIWIYTSWLIVLFGVEVVYAHQNRRSIRQECHGIPLSHAFREELALSLLAECAADFLSRQNPRTLEQLTEGIHLPARQVRELLGDLEEEGFLARLAGDEPHWHPECDPNRLKVAEVLTRLRQRGGSCIGAETGGDWEPVRRVLYRSSLAVEREMGELTVGDLAGQVGRSFPDGTRPGDGMQTVREREVSER